MKSLLIAILLILLASRCGAQAPGAPNATLGPRQQSEVVDSVISVLLANYVFPEVAVRMATDLRGRVARGEFDDITSATAFADTLTSLLYEIGQDRHLWISYDPGAPPEPPRESTPTSDEAPDQSRRRRNFGFPRAEILLGNVGYMDLRMFIVPEAAGETAAAVMAFLSNTEALIIDLRQNGGGSPDMVALVASYFFDSKPVHLFDVYMRVADRTDQYWTSRYLPGRRLATQPVYVLTRSSTFSAGEAFAYTMKHLERATIVGETTGGAAHPGRDHRISQQFVMFVAHARAISPVTGTNWEGVGVTPDVDVPAEVALETAHVLALEALLQQTTDGERVAELQRLIDDLKERL
jgi:hypothetical protein